MTASDNDSGVSEASATATTSFIIVVYLCLPPPYDSVGPMVLDRSKLIGPVQTSDGLWTMCIASIWTGLGSRTGGPDHWARWAAALESKRVPSI